MPGKNVAKKVNTIISKKGSGKPKAKPKVAEKNDLLQEHAVIDLIKLKPFQENRKADDKSVSEIAESIKFAGQLVPIIVDEDFTIIDGERRFRALLSLGRKTASVLIQKNHADATRVVTNIIRNNFTVEYLKSIFEKQLKQKGMTQIKLAQIYGLTQGRISQIINSGKPKDDTQKRIRTVKVEPVENIKIVVTEKKTVVSFELSNKDARTPVKFMTELMKEISWRKVLGEAKKQIDI